MGAEIDHLRAIDRICDEHVRVATALRTLAPDVDRVVSIIARSMAEGGRSWSAGMEDRPLTRSTSWRS